MIASAPEVESAIARMEGGEVVMLENVRFHPEEEENDANFAKQLAALADVYVNDAFGTAHRAHASTEGVARILPGVCGFLIAKELEIMGKALDDPKRPFVAIIGGAKVSTKITVIGNLARKVDTLIIGGGMIFTFLKARGVEVGRSLVEEKFIGQARGDLEGAHGDAPSEARHAGRCGDHDRACRRCAVQGRPDRPDPGGHDGRRYRPRNGRTFQSRRSRSAGTIIWNGPLGVFELEPFDRGTNEIARALAASGAVTIIGGGDSASAVEKAGVADKMTHISTGGGASLEYLEGRELPGIAILQDR